MNYCWTTGPNNNTTLKAHNEQCSIPLVDGFIYCRGLLNTIHLDGDCNSANARIPDYEPIRISWNVIMVCLNAAHMIYNCSESMVGIVYRNLTLGFGLEKMGYNIQGGPNKKTVTHRVKLTPISRVVKTLVTQGFSAIYSGPRTWFLGPPCTNIPSCHIQGNRSCVGKQQSFRR